MCREMDTSQICVITPLSRTPQWHRIENDYGILDKDWHHYNSKHLVCNHPNINSKEMRDLLDLGFCITYPRIRNLEASLGFVKRYIDYRGFIGGMGYSIKHFIHANNFDYHPKRCACFPWMVRIFNLLHLLWYPLNTPSNS